MRDGSNETDFVHALLPKIGEAGVVVGWRNNAGKVQKGEHWIHVGTAGMSDILGFTRASPRRFVAFEIKSPTAKWTKRQRDFLALVRDSGHVAAEYRYDESKSWDDNIRDAVETLCRAIDAVRSNEYGREKALVGVRKRTST